MPALKEFANFITLNMANLAETYSRLLAEGDGGYKDISSAQRTAVARRLLKAVIEACESETAAPVCHLFADQTGAAPRRWPKDIIPPQPWLEVDCLGQTLIPVATNLEAAQFVWQILSEARTIVLQSTPQIPSPLPAATQVPPSLPAVSPLAPAEIEGVVDIVSPRQPARELPTAERNLLHTLIDNMPGAHIFVKDAQSRFVITNTTHLQTVGAKTLDEIIGKTDFDLFPRELAAQYYADEQAIIQSRQPLLNRTELVVDQAGRRKWYLTTKVPLYDHEGQPVGLVGMSRDITTQYELEQQIEESLKRRTLQVQTSVEVAQEIADAPGLDELFQRIVDRVQARFGYYYVYVYTLEGDQLALQAGSGEVGRRMKADGHKIPLATTPSLIARAACSGQAVLAPDVSKEPGWLPHPLLPATKAELSIPIKLGGKVLGVLNVENDTVSSLDEDDQLLLLGLCGQIAIAINYRRAEAARKRVEAELQVSETKIHDLLITVDEAVMLLDEKGFIDCSPATLKLFGYSSKEQFINTHPSEQSPATQPDGRDSWTAANEKIATAYREGSNRFEWMHCRADGVAFPAEVLLTRVELEGRPILQATVRDISEYKRAQEDLAQEQYLLHALLDNIPDHIYFKDTASRFIRLSRSQAERFGLSDPAQAVGKTDFDFFSEAHARPAFEDEQRIIETGRPMIGLEEKEVWPDGEVTWVSTTKMPLRDKQGQIIGTFGTSREITERKRIEEAITKRAAELETVAQMSVAVSTVLDTRQLLQTVVDLTKERFNLYHAHIYLLNEAGDTLELAAGAGEVGRQMVAKGWRIPLAQVQSLVAQAARAQPGIIVNDARQSPDWLPNALLPDTRSELAVPLIAAGQLLGVLDVQADKINHFHNEDLHIQTTLARQVAVALQNTRQYQQTQRALAVTEKLAREQAVLNELGQILTARLSVDQVLEEAYRQISRLIDTADFYIGLHEPGQEQIKFPFVVTHSEIDRKIITISVNQGLAGYIIRHKTSMLLEDNVKARQEALGIQMMGEESLSWLGVPLLLADQVIGVMAVQSFSTPRLYTEHDLELMKAIGNQVAIAIHNAQQFEETQTALAEARQSQELLRTVIDATPDWIFVKDQQHRYRLANQGYAEALHLSSEDFIGKNDLDLGFPEDLVKGNPEKGIRGFWADDREVLDWGEPLANPHVPATIDGVIHIFDDRKLPLRDANGQVWAVLGISRDVTEREELLSDVQKTQQEVESRLRETQILQQLTQRLAGTLQVDEVIQAFFLACTRLLGADYVLFSLVDKQQRRIKAIAGINVTDDHLKRANHPLDSQDIMADIVRTGHTDIITGWDPRFDTENFKAEGMAQWGLRIFTPINVRQENIGLVEVGYKEKAEVDVQDTQVKLLRILVDQTAIAVESAQRYEASQRAARREQTIRQITDKMRAATNLNELAKTVAEELGQRLSAGHAVVELGLESEKLLTGVDN